MIARSAAFFVACALFFAVNLSSPASGEGTCSISDGERYFGIYVAGEKVGWQRIAIERKKVGDKENYRLTASEARIIKVKDKENTDTIEITATIGLDFSPTTLEITDTKSGKKSTIKAVCAAKSVEINANMGGSALPPRKLPINDGDCWSFCAPLLFAARKHDSGKPAKYSRIVENGGVIQSFTLNPSKIKPKFQGKDVEIVEWVEAETGKLLFAVDAEGNLLYWSETTKTKVTTKYVFEPVECAKSKMDFDAWEKSNEGKPTDPKAKKNPLKGTLFENALDPVEEDAEEKVEGPKYIKVPSMKFSIRFADGYYASTSTMLVGGIQGQKFSNFTICAKVEGYMWLLDVVVADNKDGLSAKDALEWYPAKNFLAGLKITEDISMITIGDTDFAYTSVTIEKDGEAYSFLYAATASDKFMYFFAPGLSARADPKTVTDAQKSDIPKMIGSFRLLD